MKAVILAGGKALRLRPLTWRRPKAVVPILGQPFLISPIELLRAAGVTDIALALASVPRRIHAVFGDGSAHRVSVHYSVESEPMGTGGALGRLRSRLPSTFLCLNGDILSDLDVRGLIEAHRRSGAVLTLAVTRVPDARNFGAVRVEPGDGGLRVAGFEEKGAQGPGLVSVGIYAMEPAVFDRIPEGRPVSLEREVFPAAVAASRAGGPPVAAFEHDGYFSDIGVLDRYRAVHRDALDGRIRIPGVGSPNPGGVFVGAGTRIDPEARIVGPSFIGDGATVRAGAQVGPYAVLGRRVRVGARARVSDSVLWLHTRIGEDAVVRGTVFAASCFVGQGALVRDAVLGDKSVVAAWSVVGGSR